MRICCVGLEWVSDGEISVLFFPDTFGTHSLIPVVQDYAKPSGAPILNQVEMYSKIVAFPDCTINSPRRLLLKKSQEKLTMVNEEETEFTSRTKYLADC